MFAAFINSALVGVFKGPVDETEYDLVLPLDKFMFSLLVENIKLWRKVEVVGQFPNIGVRVLQYSCMHYFLGSPLLHQSHRITDEDNASIKIEYNQAMGGAILHHNDSDIAALYVVHPEFPTICIDTVTTETVQNPSIARSTWDMLVRKTAIGLTPRHSTHAIIVPTGDEFVADHPSNVITLLTGRYEVDPEFPAIAVRLILDTIPNVTGSCGQFKDARVTTRYGLVYSIDPTFPVIPRIST